MYKIAGLFIIYLIANMSIAQALDISHPPTFEQINKANKDDNDSDLNKAFQYDSDDIKHLLKQDNINYVIAIAYQQDISEAINLMMNHLPEVKKNALGLSLLISCTLREDKLNEKLPIEHLTKELIKLLPNNGYSYYLIAAYYAKKDNFEKCITYTKQAVAAAKFNNYWIDYTKNSISTSTFLGYSKLAAQMHSLGLQHDLFIYYKLADYILNNNTDRDNILLCNKMGTILKDNSTTILGDLVSYGIQKKSLEKLSKYKNTEKELKDIEKALAPIRILSESLNKISKANDISEKRWVQYYSDVYGKSEQYAIKQLMSEYPINKKIND